MSDSPSPFQSPSPEEMAEILPSYSQIRFLAQGGMAAVYKGVQTSLDRPVAIKVLPREFGADESFRLRFGAEAKTMAKLNHPNLVSIFDFGQVDDLLYLVMEFVEGETLYSYAYNKKLAELEALGFAVGVAEGLAHAHENEILHRDIKPSNILLDEKRNPKLGDFGLAQGGEREEGDDLVFGTPGYTSPEVMADPHCADQRADIFAVGVLLHELLTAELPAKPYLPPSRLVQSDPRIDAIITKCLQTNPALRYPSASGLATDLRNLIKQIETSPRTRLATATSTASAARTLKVEPAAPAPEKERSPALATSDSTPPSPRPAPAVSSSGPDFNLIRNLIIIAALSLAIWGAWTVLQIRKADIAAQQEVLDKAEAKKKRKKEAEIAARRLELEEQRRLQAEKTPKTGIGSSTPAAGTEGGGTTPPPEPEPVVVELTPLEQLAELRSALVAGSRDAYPEGTQQRGASHYFFVETPLTWHEALVFAEDHGGHLAVVPNKSDLAWVRTLITSGDQIWLGAGATARSGWSWVDSSVEFENQDLSTSVGAAATVTKYSPIKGAKPSTRLPFVIEWKNDGSNNGELKTQLQNLMDTLESRNTSWPPGTLALEERRYLIIARKLTFAEAEAFALTYQGHLAVPSTEIEAAFLLEKAVLAGLDTLWFGGQQQQDGNWSWVSNEPWTFARWAESYPAEDRDLTALVLAQGGWQNADPNLEASGFIIEWSDDAKNAPKTVAESPLDSSAELKKLQAIANQVIQKSVAAYAKKVKMNSDAQGSVMRQWIRNIPKEDALVYAPIYDSYVTLIDASTGRLPDPAGTQELPALPEKAAAILNRHFQEQVKYDAELEASAATLRTSYLRQIVAKIDELEGKGLKTQTGVLTQEIQAVGQSGSDFLDRFQANPLK